MAHTTSNSPTTLSYWVIPCGDPCARCSHENPVLTVLGRELWPSGWSSVVNTLTRLRLPWKGRRCTSFWHDLCYAGALALLLTLNHKIFEQERTSVIILANSLFCPAEMTTVSFADPIIFVEFKNSLLISSKGYPWNIK